jgi:MotA/TolQ/ExbB proton channel family
LRRALIQTVLPFIFCLVPLLAAALVVGALPPAARDFYFKHLTTLDILILALGCTLFGVQLLLAWQSLRWRGPGFDERPDPWLSHLAQAAEWFPLLGLLGTVAGILQTFAGTTGSVTPAEVIRNYAPAITATGSGLLMALVNILPAWVVLLGRQLIQALGGGEPAAHDKH